jgi:predicted nucleotidyltransferase
MPNSDLALKVCSKLLDIQNMHPTVTIFIFGSILTGRSYFSDIDILTVSKTEKIPFGLRHEIECLGEIHPIHLLIMSKREEEQFRFIELQGAISVGQLAQHSV